jgi:hypothetical protein
MVRGRWLGIGAILCLSLLALTTGTSRAADSFPDQQASGSTGLQGTITATPPTRAATISVPGNGAVFTQVPITIGGLCPNDVIVKVFSNNVFIGSTLCIRGSYTLQADLFSGQNELVARVYDSLDQAGPDSNTVTVTFNDAQFAAFGNRVTLTSIYARRGSPPGQVLTWPVVLDGGVGPYAISVDWGDGSATDLFSQSAPGTINLKHTYKNAGIYRVIIKATDKNGTTAFLQLVGQATGATQTDSKKDADQNAMLLKRELLWWPALAMFPLVGMAYWVGRRSELFTLRKQLEKTRDKEV